MSLDMTTAHGIPGLPLQLQYDEISACADLLRPSESVMDLNIGAALWLAAQAEGPVLIHRPRQSPAASPTHSAPPADQPSPCDQAAQQQHIYGQTADGVVKSVGRGEPAGSGNVKEDVGQIRSGVEEGGRYRSRSRVVLLGHGADELCAGYGRHRTRFRSHVRLMPASLN